MSQKGQEWLGRVLSDTYRIESFLGQGGIGMVYQARHLRTGGLCAVKLLGRQAAANKDIYRRFQEEARITSALRHPHIVQVMDFDQHDGTPFLAMELLDGEDLHHRLREVGRIPIQQALDIAWQAGTALQAAHEHGVIHRDIKPQNIFLARHRIADELVEVAKVVDFGLSKILHDGSPQTGEHQIVGTPYYMAPEAIRERSANIDGRADQYSLAVILYRALSGQLPFDNDDIMEVLPRILYEEPVPLIRLAPWVPGSAIAAIERAMSKDRERRFKSMTAFLHALCGTAMVSTLSGPHSNPRLKVVQPLPDLLPDETTTQGQRLQVTSSQRLPIPHRHVFAGACAGVLVAALVLIVLAHGQRRPAPASARPAPAAAPFATAPPGQAAAPERRVVASAPEAQKKSKNKKEKKSKKRNMGRNMR